MNALACHLDGFDIVPRLREEATRQARNHGLRTGHAERLFGGRLVECVARPGTGVQALRVTCTWQIDGARATLSEVYRLRAPLFG